MNPTLCLSSETRDPLGACSTSWIPEDYYLLLLNCSSVLHLVSLWLTCHDHSRKDNALRVWGLNPSRASLPGNSELSFKSREKPFLGRNNTIVHNSGPERAKNVTALLRRNTWRLVTHRVPGAFQVVGIEKQQKHKYQMSFGIL